MQGKESFKDVWSYNLLQPILVFKGPRPNLIENINEPQGG